MAPINGGAEELGLVWGLVWVAADDPWGSRRNLAPANGSPFPTAWQSGGDMEMTGT